MSGAVPWKVAPCTLSFAEFVSGKQVDFGPEWPFFRFSYPDSRWYFLDALTPGKPTDNALCNFDRLPAWMNADARKCMASAWLERNRPAGTLAGYMNAMALLARAFPQPQGGLLELTSGQGREFTAFLQREIDHGTFAPATCASMLVALRAVFRTLRMLPENEHRPCEFAVRPPQAVRRHMARQKTAFNARPEKVIPDQVIAGLLRACREEEAAYESVLAGEADARELVLGSRGASVPTPTRCRNILRNRAIQAQLLKFAICFGRRISALCALPVAPELEEVKTPRGRVLLLYIHEAKLKKATEIARAPGLFADLASDALAKAIRYTAEYRAEAGELGDHLFLMSAHRKKGRPPVKVITGSDFNRYLSGIRAEDGDLGKHSLIARYGITINGKPARITSHNFRTTRLTRIAERAGPTVASQDAGHLSPDMTSHFYIAATGALRERAERALRQGAYTGEVADMIAGRAEGERVSLRMTQRLMNQDQPVMVNVTRYGLCFLQAETGPCPTGNACWLGVNPDAPEIAVGRGCEWQGLTAAAVPALAHDEKTLLAQIELYGASPRFRHFVPNLERRLEIVRVQLARARAFARDGETER